MTAHCKPALILRKAGCTYASIDRILALVPSQYAHLLFAQLALHQNPVRPESANPYLLMGAQGPDMFYHNRRRKPSGIRYGGIIHRKNIGHLVASMRDQLIERDGVDALVGSSEFLYVRAYASHAVLDRYAHPFINYFAGWRRPGDSHSRRYRRAHTFAERIIDVVLAERYLGLHPREMSFAARIESLDTLPGELEQLLMRAIRAVYRSAGDDHQIEHRIRNAYLDMRGFYQFMD